MKLRLSCRLVCMEWAAEIPGLASIAEAFLETDIGALILENREWLFDGLGVTVSLGILAGISAVMRIVCGVGWALCCLCGRGLRAGIQWRPMRQDKGSKPDIQAGLSKQPVGESTLIEKRSPSSVITPSQAEISYITGMSPDFDPFLPRASAARPASRGYAASAPSRHRAGAYSSWPRYFGTLAKLLLLAAAINAFWVSIVALK